MEMVIPRSVRPARQLLRTCPHRSFTATSALSAGSGGVKQGKQQAQLKTVKGPSPKAAQKDQMRSSEGQAMVKEMMSDIGLLHGTYVKPAGAGLPRWHREPRLRLRIEWTQFFARARGILSLFVFRWQARNWPNRPRFPLKTWLPLHPSNPLQSTAEDLYKRYQKGMTEMDRKALKTIMGKGLYEFVAPKLAARPQTDLVDHKSRHLREPRIVSDRIGMLPVQHVQHCAVRQVVVRLHTEQSLERYSATTNEVANRLAPRTVIEFLVMQQRIWAGEKEKWIIQGFQEPMLPAEFHKRNSESEAKMVKMQSYIEKQGLAAS